MHLYELAQEYKFIEAVAQSDEPDREAMQVALDGITAKFQNKAVNVGKIIMTLLAEANGIQTEINRLACRQSALQNKAQWLKEYLFNQMVETKIDKIEGDVLTLSLRPNPPSVNIVDQNCIPIEYRRIIPETWQPDKKAIIDQFKKTGEVIPGCEIIKDKKSLVIR